MVDDSPRSVHSLQVDIDAVRAAFGEQRAQLEVTLGRLYEDAPGVADELLSMADEFGQEHTVLAFSERPHDFGKVRELPHYPWAETAEHAREQLAKLVDAHDRLDHLTLQREVLLRRSDPARLPVVNIQGEEFTLDEARRELRATDRLNDRHPLNLEDAERSMSENIARDRDVSRVEAQQPDARDRTRNR